MKHLLPPPPLTQTDIKVPQSGRHKKKITIIVRPFHR
jgi:hypothetical protein